MTIMTKDEKVADNNKLYELVERLVPPQNKQIYSSFLIQERKLFAVIFRGNDDATVIPNMTHSPQS